MQTKRQIRQLLISAGIRPNTHLGQHFLIDLNLMRLMVDSANITGNDIVLEVGSGTGSLTEALIEKAGMVIAVELDRSLAEIAKSRLTNYGNIEVINTDILEKKSALNNTVTNALEAARKKYHGRILLVANLPYNAASPTILNLVTGPMVADAMYVTVQKEVADRMTAVPASRNYGVLSIFLTASGDIKTLRILKPTVFWPQPQVDSAMVGFVHRPAKSKRIENMQIFSEIVHFFMGHRRKMLKACTKFAGSKFAKINNWPEIFKRCSIEPTLRPEELGAEDYIAIANSCRDVPEGI
jgi:16S rRNA (adenine1518-N6/adenine1519-N6)-dimethyltransferase